MASPKRAAIKRKSRLQRGKPLRPISKKLRAAFKKDKLARAFALERDGYHCVGTPLNPTCAALAVEVHHVRSRGIPSTRHLAENHASMCLECHDWAQANLKVFRAWWDQR